MNGTDGLDTDASFHEEGGDGLGAEATLISEHGTDVAEVFSVALARIFRLRAGREAGGASLTTSIRAEADELPALFAGLIDAANDAAENLGMVVISAGVDGIVRSESGYVSWGVIGVVPITEPSPEVRLAAPPTVREDRGEIVVEARLRRVNPGRG